MVKYLTFANFTKIYDFLKVSLESLPELVPIGTSSSGGPRSERPLFFFLNVSL